MMRAQSKRLFETVYTRDAGRCVYCGTSTQRPRAGIHRAPDRATLDHVIPKALGGRLTPDNLVLACQACNNERGTLDADVFRNHKTAQ
jgi:5-methylcytosine-specific restriction endonuclease McrA